MSFFIISHNDELLNLIVTQCMKIDEHDKRSWSEWRLCEDIRILDKVAQECIKLILSNKVSQVPKSVCAMFRSGVPLAVSIAQKLKLPFFCVDGNRPLSRKESIGYLSVEDPPEERVLLVDSHIRRGNTAWKCIKRLRQENIQIIGILTSIMCDIPNQDYSRFNIPVYSIGNLSSIQETLRSVLCIPEEESLDRYLNGGNFWKPFTRSYPNDFEANIRNTHSKVSGTMHPIDLELGKEILQICSFRDSVNMFRLFLKPQLIEECCKKVLQSGILSQIDIIAACGRGGIIFTTFLSLKSHIPCVYVEPKQIFSNNMKNLRNKRILLCDTTIKTGGHAICAYKQLRAQGAVINKMVILHHHNIRHTRRSELDRLLQQYGVDIYYFSLFSND